MKLKSLSFGKAAGLAIASVAFGLLGTAQAQASTFTRTSLTSAGLLPGTVSEIGGIVLDLIGTNGTRVVTQTAASTLFVGGSPSTNPLTIGTQTGFTASVIGQLGGGISQASVRLSLFDGDSAAGDFDVNDNTLALNGITFGNFTAVSAVNTDSVGNETSLGFSGGGFRDGTLDTGFFFSNDTTTLASLFASLSGGNVVFELNDVDPGDQFYDFAQGLSASVVNVGTGPVVTSTPVIPGIPPTGAGTSVPEPFTVIGSLIGGTAAFRMRKKLKSSDKA
jgi:hypothetical protein